MLPIVRTILTAYWRKGMLWQFLGLGVLVGLFSIIAVSISLGESSKVMTDVWMTGIEMVGLMSVIFFVATAWRRACHDHTVHLLLTHYHRRVAIYVAYFLAYLTLIAALYSLMIFIAILTMFIAGYPPLIGFFGAVGLSFVKMIGLTSVARVLGTIMSGYLASIITLVVYVIGHSTGFIAYYFHIQDHTIGSVIGRVLYYIFPNFQVLDSHPFLAATASSLDIILGISIMIIYSVIVMYMGAYIIRHQEL